MSDETFPPQLQSMIDRAGVLTLEQTGALASLWEGEEGLVLPEPSIAADLIADEDYQVLVTPWRRVLGEP